MHGGPELGELKRFLDELKCSRASLLETDFGRRPRSDYQHARIRMRRLHSCEKFNRSGVRRIEIEHHKLRLDLPRNAFRLFQRTDDARLVFGRELLKRRGNCDAERVVFFDQKNAGL